VHEMGAQQIWGSLTVWVSGPGDWGVWRVGFESGSGGLGLGSRVLGLGCWVSGLESWVLGYLFLSLGSWVLTRAGGPQALN
jgi:hypothetical protein